MILLRIVIMVLLMVSGVDAVAAPRLPDLFVMHHLESRGTGSDARLSEIGANSARRLAMALKDFDLKAIYTATEQVSLDSSAWLAIEIGVNPQLFDPDRLDLLMVRLAQVDGPVLVIASKGYAAQIIARASGKAAPKMGEDAFGIIWRISHRDKSVSTLHPFNSIPDKAASGNLRQGRRLSPSETWLDEGEVAEE